MRRVGVVLLFCLLTVTAGVRADEGARLHAIAQASLQANVVTLESGPYLVAGQHQFRSLWTRDFCFASRGLLLLDRADVVRNHLTALALNRRLKDGLVPR